MKVGNATGSSVLLRVLVADSGISVNDGLTAMLSEFEGLSVLGCVQEPAKVLALVKTARPDVVILDLQTHQAIGLKMLKQIKRLPRAPVVIVLSHYDLPPLRQAAGADYFLNKATECGRLQEVLHALMRERDAHVHPLAGPAGTDQPVSTRNGKEKRP
jgi:DNA-binding NarL/FixJ family response regulator